MGLGKETHTNTHTQSRTHLDKSQKHRCHYTYSAATILEDLIESSGFPEKPWTSWTACSSWWHAHHGGLAAADVYRDLHRRSSEAAKKSKQ